MKLTTKNLTLIAIIAALYTALTFIFADVSYGPVQFRISEVLTVLPLFSFVSIYGVTLGCFTSNFVGLCVGAKGTSVPDLFIGPFATLISAFCCYYLGKYFIKTGNRLLIYIFGMLPVVLINGVAVGLELTYINKLGSFSANFWGVVAGELAVCYGLGLFLIHVLLKNDFYRKLF